MPACSGPDARGGGVIAPPCEVMAPFIAFCSAVEGLSLCAKFGAGAAGNGVVEALGAGLGACGTGSGGCGTGGATLWASSWG